ncbi:KEOPS complex subunit Pcc1 [Haloferax sp. DFSO60]|uniref:KEOPS complex subunit Pcc1 n=1 Tax=Haloferax sp. DFSO60 TaxID=3388652 RepID=UPI00397C8B79
MRPAHSASLEFDYPDERRARIVERAVAVEVGEIDDARSGASVERDGTTVVITVKAGDLVALRAGMNSWIRLAETAESVSQAGDRRARSA